MGRQNAFEFIEKAPNRPAVNPLAYTAAKIKFQQNKQLLSP